MEYELIQFSESQNYGRLTKGCYDEQLKRYFERVFELYKSGDKFPVDLDEVWMLVYAERGKAVRALRQNFYEQEDYEVFAQNGKNSDGRPKIYYRLSLECMEYFIARKVRSVFNVYREVTKRVVLGELPMSTVVQMQIAKEKMEMGALWVEKVSNIIQCNDTSKVMMLRKVAEPLGLPVPDYVQSKGVHHSAKELLKKNNIPLSSQAFNKLALAGGYLETKTRKTKNGEKSFYVISNKGLIYGENLVSDHNPNETQPHWYDDRFTDLLKVIGVTTQQSMF